MYDISQIVHGISLVIPTKAILIYPIEVILIYPTGAIMVYQFRSKRFETCIPDRSDQNPVIPTGAKRSGGISND